MPTLTDLKKAFISAYDDGEMAEAGHYKQAIEFEEARRSKDPSYTREGAHMGSPDVPGYVSDDVTWMNQAEDQPGMLSKAADVVGGVAEVPVAMASGIAGQGVGMANMANEGAKSFFRGQREEGSGLKGLDQYLRGNNGKQADQAFNRGAESVAYQPKTDTAQGALQALAKLVKPLPPVLAPSLAQATMAGQAVRGVSPIARARVLDPSIAASKQAAKKVPEFAGTRARELAQVLSERKTNKGLDKSIGAAELPKARLIAERARELDDPIDLTIADATRNPEALRFEREGRKMPEGAAFREAEAVKNQKVANNLDLWIDETGADLVAIGDKGRHLDDSLTRIIERKNEQVGAAYREAEAAGHMSVPVELKQLTDMLNDPIKRAEAVNDGVLKTTRRVLIETGAATESDGMLMPNRVNLVEGEQIRRSIGNNVGIGAADRRQGRLLKRAYDADTENLGGTLYKRARSQRREFAEQFENNELVRKLTGENPQSGEKLVAIESMVDTILSPSSGLASVDRLKKLRTILLKDEGGRQSWKEMQSELVERIKTQTFRTSNFDESGNPIPSYAGLSRAIKELDRSGKLDIILTKKGAEKMRTLQEVVKYIYTAPPGVINHSNTGTVLAGLLDGSMLGMGIPNPFIASAVNQAVKKIKDVKLQRKIQKHLEGVL